MRDETSMACVAIGINEMNLAFIVNQRIVDFYFFFVFFLF